MSIESSPFGGLKLTGEDAIKFRNQVRHGRPKRAAIEAVRRGVELARQLAEHSYVRLALAAATGAAETSEDLARAEGSQSGGKAVAPKPYSETD